MERPPQEIATGPEASAANHHRRVRRGRERGIAGPGEHLVARLGPVGPDVARYHNPSDLSRLAAASAGDGEAALESTPVDELVFVSLDCETTGHFPHRMVELGAVRFRLELEGDGAEPRISLESLVHTEDYINPYARRVHGIQRAMLGGAPTLHQVATAFDQLARGSVLVEHSADGFDTRLVSQAIGRPLDNHHLDTSRLAGFLFELRDTIGLERLCEQLGVTHRSPHYALADAEATADCFVQLVQLGRERFGWRTLGDLIEVGMPPPPRTTPRPRSRPRPAPTPTVAEPAAEGSRPTRPRHRGGRNRRRRSGEAPALEAKAGD